MVITSSQYPNRCRLGRADTSRDRPHSGCVWEANTKKKLCIKLTKCSNNIRLVVYMEVQFAESFKKNHTLVPTKPKRAIIQRIIIYPCLVLTNKCVI